MAEQKNVRIFVSSTFVDLVDERKAVEETLKRIRQTAFGAMEYFGSRDDNTLHASLDEVKASDVYVGIFGARYGSGITEKEYRAAQDLGLPCLIYFRDDAGLRGAAREPRLDALKDELQKEHTVSRFRSADHLGALVATDLFRLLVGEAGGLAATLKTYIANVIADPGFRKTADEQYFDLHVGRRPESLEIPLRLKQPATPSQTVEQKLNVRQALEDSGRLVVIGEPGAGKTTALRHLAFSLAHEFHDADATRPRESSKVVPVYVSLANFNSVSGDTAYERMIKLIRNGFERCGAPLSADAVAMLLKTRPLALLLDGLNEIGSQQGIDALVDGVEVFLRTHPTTFLIITSRSYSFQFRSHRLPVYELVELRYPQDIEAFAALFLAQRADVERFVGILSENLPLRQLSVNPLLLSLTIYVFKQGRKLPNSRGQLLHMIAGALLESAPGRYWTDDKIALLSRLGYAMKEEGLEVPESRAIEIFRETLEADPAWFSSANSERPRDCIAPAAGLDWQPFVEELRNQRVFSQAQKAPAVRFWHQTLQEYFAARSIWSEIGPLFQAPQGAPLAADERRRLGQLFERYVSDLRWHETLAIVSGLIERPAPQAGQDDRAARSFIDAVWRRDRLVAAMCLGNVEHPERIESVPAYVRALEKNITLWGRYAARVYPWAAVLLAAALAWLAGRVASNWLIASLIGTAFSVLYLYIYARGLRTLEDVANDRYLRPSLSALGHIRNNRAQAVLAELHSRIAGDPAVGEATRQLVATSLSLPVRDESELIHMLDNSATRLQAMERLVEIGSDRSIEAVAQVLDREAVGRLSYKTAIRSLVRMTALRSAEHPVRTRITSRLASIQKSNPDYAKRLAAYDGLRELGIPGIAPPEEDLLRRALGESRLVKIGAVVLVALFATYGWTLR